MSHKRCVQLNMIKHKQSKKFGIEWIILLGHEMDFHVFEL